MFNQIGLRSEIIIQLTLLMIAAIVFISLLLMKQSQQDLLLQRIEQNVTLLQVFSETINLSLPSEDILEQLKKADVKFLAAQNLRAIAIADRQKTLASINHSGDPAWPELTRLSQALLTNAPVIESDYSAFSNQAHMLVTLPLKSKNRRQLAILARFSLDDIRPSAFKARTYVLLYVMLCGLILIMFGSYLLERSIVRPIQHIKEASTAIAQGELTQHVSIKGPREIAQLANSFNKMSTALKKSQNEAQDHIQTLEKVNHELKITRHDLVQSEKMASIGNLTAGMAHEIGNPLGALIGYLDLLKSQPAAALSNEILQGATHEANRIDQLVRDLLDYARPCDSSADKADLTEVLSRTIKLLGQQHEFSNYTIDLQVPDIMPSVNIAGARLQQIIINLLTNARDASPPGSRIQLKAKIQNAKTLLQISDTGQGIPDNLLPRLFDPFYTSKPPGEGRGLGLFISHRMVTDAGGSLQAVNNPNGGATFTISLPNEDLS